jgi:transcriptional regulator with XRE-family HTH domain
MRPPKSVARALGRSVKECRLKIGMTQQQLADACGLDIGYIGGIERGQRNPTLGVMQSIASVLEVRVSHLLKKANL